MTSPIARALIQFTFRRQPQDDIALALRWIAQRGVGYRRARLSALAGGVAFGCGVGFGAVASSSFASAAR